MKFALVALLFCLGAASAHVNRLPLPKAIQALHPELLAEPLFEHERIVGGVNAVAGEAKHQIGLFRSGSFSCGGSLIQPNVVLTAAHCVDGSENRPSIFTIRYGSLKQTGGTLVNVKKINKHEKYSSSTIDNDVAILVLSASISPSDNAGIISLTASAPAAGTKVTVTGWGRTSAGGSLPADLKKADQLVVKSQQECQSAWGSVNAITAQMLCAHDKQQSACNGDSGGPLTLNGVLVGVVSWGSSQCRHDVYPNVYANVATLRTWILNNQS